LLLLLGPHHLLSLLCNPHLRRPVPLQIITLAPLLLPCSVVGSTSSPQPPAQSAP
jgi:hypothetical protein